ncbi:type 2 periplasmic-binding domain-containing protein [Mycoplasmopsis primatum]|uniref:membrane protein n=1 Tax=Mycoplasmopsis primatum TaxID=55604 RepID=UPI0004950151|nr:membrane protein [Mycoplasmopsis primatum]
MKNNKFLNFCKTQLFTRKTGYIAIAASVPVIFSSVVSYKYLANKFKPVFYNYQSYMDDHIVSRISEDFDFKQFSVLNEFTKAILTHKAAGGIGSDSQAAKLLINDHHGAPLLRRFTKKDFKTMFLAQWNDAESVEENLKKIYTPLVFDHLKSYDNLFEDLDAFDEKGNPIKGKKQKDLAEEDKIHLYNYFVPYFAQDMVIAYNPQKIAKYKKLYTPISESEPEEPSDDASDKEIKEYEQKKQVYDQLYHEAIKPYFSKVHNDLETQINKKIKDLIDPETVQIQMHDILKLIRNPISSTNENEAFHYYEYTDAVRDNMIYGSSYRLDTKSGKHIAQPTGKAVVEEETSFTKRKIKTEIYKDLIDQFVDMFHHSTGYKLTNTEHVRTSGNGQDLLNTLIDPLKKTNVGIIYNGDALDAYYSSDNIANNDVPNGTVRFIRPSTNLLLVDGFVIANSTDEETAQKMITTAEATFLGGLDQTQDHWSVENLANAKKNISNDKDVKQTYKDYGAYFNFDYVRYTPAFKNIYNYVLNHEFEDDIYTGFSKEFNSYQRTYLKNLYKIEEKYEFDAYKSPDKNKEDLNDLQGFTYYVKHVPISPVTNQIQTLINIYYDYKLKG